IIGVSLRNGLRNEVIKKGLGIDELSDAIRGIRLRWFGHVERKANEYWVKKFRTIITSDLRKSGR
ncbi:hypothetical protein HELRODRAFT_153040, partial [Helobdella robusta]|uniref:Reverse transcriptase domain-containing protein n=1 Tax=Helobdella robusta TaxID=6412 RepID=T1EKY9_HELRO